MNLLAHAWLSFYHPDILAGNMISDYVKGNKKFTYSPGVQQGIALHRAIDEFTDIHPVTTAAKEYFRPAYRLYAGAFTDVMYDHFLASDTAEFKDAESLQAFAHTTYNTLEQYRDILPEKFARMLPYMISQNWLYNYQFKDGMQQSFAGLARRAAYISDSTAAFEVFEKHYQDFKIHYQQFFPELKTFVKTWLQEQGYTVV